MSQDSKKTIAAIVEIEASYKHDGIMPPWKISKSDDYLSYARLYAGISDEEIGSVMYIACNYNSEDEIIKETAIETLKAFISQEDFVLPGGLQFKENGKVKMTPACCCGLEEWKDWQDVSIGESDIWNGHDPFALVKKEGEIIKIWANMEDKDKLPSIEFTVKELIDNIKIVEQDLKDFLVRLTQWTKNIEPSLESRLVNHFARNMNIDL